MLDHTDDAYFPNKPGISARRWVFWPTAVGAVLTLLVALSACSNTQQAPPGMPTIAEVQAQLVATSSIPPGLVREFYTSGLTLVQMRCGGYFDQAVMSALNNAQTTGQAQLLSGLAGGIMGLAGVGGPAVAGAGLGAAFLSNMIANQQSNSLAGTDPAGTATLVSTAQQTLINATQEPASAADAWAAIYAVYRACSPAGIQALKEQAIAAAPNHLVVTPPLQQRQLRGLGPSPMRALPMIRVN